MSVFLGVDIGGTNVKTALVGVDGAVLSFESNEWSGGPPADAVDTAVASARTRMSETGLGPVACGCACAGLIDSAEGIVRYSPNLPEWCDVELSAMLSCELGLPVVLENDANAAAYAEFEVGAGRGARTMVMLTLGTGIGGGIVIDGRLYRGGHGMAGEIGHITVDRDGPTCACGSRGCLERLANAEAVVARAEELLGAGRDSTLRKKSAARPLKAVDVGLAASEGDEVAVEALASVGRALGVGLANVSQILDPDVIVIGGGVIAAGEPLLRPAREELEARLSGYEFRGPGVVPAALGESAGVVGAALLAREALAH